MPSELPNWYGILNRLRTPGTGRATWPSLNLHSARYRMNQNNRNTHSNSRSAQEVGVARELDASGAEIHWKCQKLTLSDIFGKPIILTYDQLVEMFTHRLTVTFLTVVAFGLYATDPHDFHGFLPWYLSIGIWLFSAYGFGFFYIVMARILWPVFVARQRTLPNVLISIPVFTAIYFIDVFIANWASSTGYSFDITLRYPFLLATFLTLDLSFTRFVLPQVMPQLIPGYVTPETSTPQKPGTQDGETPEFLRVGDRNIRVATLLAINSEEHYVHVTTTHEVITQRAKLPELVSKLAESEGVRTHRSWWVSRHARPVIKQIDGKPYVVFCGDKQAPIARSRHKDVRDWIDTHRNWE